MATHASELESSRADSSSGTPALRQAGSMPSLAGKPALFPTLGEGTEEEKLIKTDALFGRLLLQAQREGLAMESVEALLATFQDMKGLAFRQALRVAHLEGELRGGEKQEQKTLLVGGTASYCQVAATGAGVPLRPGEKEGQTEARELEALLVESKDPQAIQPEKVGEYLQRTFQPEKLGLKQVKPQKISKG